MPTRRASMITIMRTMNMAREIKHSRVLGFAPRAADSDHLSAAGRCRPEGPGEGGPESAATFATPSALYRLMAWLSPAYPIGAFSYSSGLEWAVEAGDVKNADALAAWLAVII